jgi:hypothetical protein
LVARNAFNARINPAGITESPGQRLEYRFRQVVGVSSVEVLDVQVHAAFIGEGSHELFHQLQGKVPALAARGAHPVLKIGAPAQSR